jgi:hypothetical protein
MKNQMISKWRGHNKKDARYQSIPERVLNAISAQQEASEKLVGWVQLAVVIFFGLLYAVSPKTFSRDMTFEPVPWFLGIWLIVTLIRLYLAYRYRLPAPLLYLSIIIDMSLLLGMIWSFHLQYHCYMFLFLLPCAPCALKPVMSSPPESLPPSAGRPWPSMPPWLPVVWMWSPVTMSIT